MILVTIAAILALQAEPPVAPPANPPAVQPPVPAEQPKQDAPKPEAPKPDAPKPEAPKPEAPPQDPPKPEAQPPAATNPPATAPATPPATAPAAPAKQSDDGTPSAINPAGIPTEGALPEEPRKRAYLVIDRVSVAAGQIESEDDAVIVLRDEKGRIKSFSKNRLVSITYLLEGPSGRRVKVIFNDDRVLIGSLIEDGYEFVVMEIQGIRTKYPREAVYGVRPYPTDRELYERFRTTLDPDQYAARYTLSLWLYNKKMYPESKRELESLLEATNHYDAKRLLKEVNAQIALMEGGAAAPTDPANDPSKAPSRVKPAGKLGTTLLSDADVNLIRVYELDLAKPPRLQVPESLIRTMLEKYADSSLIPAKSAEKTAFYTKEPVEIVKLLFALKARDLYGDIKVLGEPESLNMFRTRIHNAWLIGNCATSKCHGGTDAGRFFLYGKDFKDDNVRYTNLLILLRTRIDTRPLIDPEKPIDSLIYQYALPKTEARWPHPDVRGYSPIFTQGRHGLQDDFVDWVRSMRQPHGEYPIEFTPPSLKSPDRAAPTGPDR